MKKIYWLSVVLLFLLSCATETNKDPGDSLTDQNDSLARPADFAMETTALPVSPTPLPPAFALDTLSVTDTAKHLYAFFHFPVSSDEKMNAMIVKLMKENTKGYEDYHPGEFEEASVEAWISSFAVNGKMISMCFTDQSFSTGAAHFNHGYTCLNYDTVKQKQVFLTDIFYLRTEKEKQKFCDSILLPEINAAMRIETGDLKKETDFIIDKGNLIFFFDDYEKGPSMCTYSVSLQSLRSFVKKEYESIVL
jgi:hypothetical protein